MSQYSKEQDKVLDSIEWNGDEIPGVTGMTAQQLASNSAMTIWQCVIQLNDGKSAIQRDVIKHKPVVIMLVSTNREDGERFLVTREYRAGVNMVVIGFPAGCVEDGEDPRQAAYRELKEETGIEVAKDTLREISTPLGITSSENMTDEVAHLYRIKLHQFATVGQDLDDDERIQYTWISQDQLLQLVETGLIRDSREINLIYDEKIRRYRLQLDAMRKSLQTQNPDE